MRYVFKDSVEVVQCCLVFRSLCWRQATIFAEHPKAKMSHHVWIRSNEGRSAGRRWQLFEVGAQYHVHPAEDVSFRVRSVCNTCIF